MSKKNVKIVYQYDGSKFFGFQRQRDKKTVQGEIEKVIKNTFGENVNMISSGRTDRGVHAWGQVSNFFIDEKIPLEAIKRRLNKTLGKEIKVLEIEEVHENFNARYDAVGRSYLYIMKKEIEITPFESEYITGIKNDIDVNKLEKIMKVYEGKHNFSSFMKKDKVYKNPIREIYNVKCEYNSDEKKYYIKIRGNSFLKTMVRIMIGSSLAVYFQEENADYIEMKLKNPDENGKKILADAEGLYLYNVEYD